MLATDDVEEEDDGQPTVLVVDDDRDLADTYAIWLRDDFDVRVAYGGEQALETIDDDVDAVLLDRRMPDVSGDEVLERIHEEGYDCRVSMLTAVEPDTDIIEMGFDEYITKPVDRDELIAVVEDLVSRSELSKELQELTALSSTLGALEAQHNIDPLEEPEELEELRRRVERKREEVDETLDDLDDYKAGFREIG